jgi:hypothetical protein
MNYTPLWDALSTGLLIGVIVALGAHLALGIIFWRRTVALYRGGDRRTLRGKDGQR